MILYEKPSSASRNQGRIECPRTERKELRGILFEHKSILRFCLEKSKPTHVKQMKIKLDKDRKPV